MKTTLTSALVAATFAAMAYSATPVQAADVNDIASVPVDWSGVSIGINGGHSVGKSKLGSLMGGEGGIGPLSGAGSSINPSGGVFGGQFNAAMQTGRVVLGIAGDMDWAKIEASENPHFDYFAETQDFTSHVDWLGTLRGKAGCAVDRALIYGTGGIAFGGVTTSFQDGSGDKFSTDDRANGWAVGGGIDYAVSDNVFVGLEYLYVDLGSRDFSFEKESGQYVSGTTDSHLNVIRATLNYRFK